MIFTNADEFNFEIEKILTEAFEKGGEIRIPTKALKSAMVKAIDSTGRDVILTIKIPLCFDGERLNVLISKDDKKKNKAKKEENE